MSFGLSGKAGFGLLARRSGAAVVTMLVSAITGPAAAQEISDQALEQSSLRGQASGNWDLNLGGGVGAGPAYLGASRERLVPVPLASIAYDNLFGLGPMGLSFNALRWASDDAQYVFRAGR